MAPQAKYPTRLIDAALQLLGVQKFALAIHDSSFPSTPEEDIGQGSPYSRGGLDFLRFIRSLGFNAVQLGPQGKTSRGDPSPYTSGIFSKSILSLAALTLAGDVRLKGLVSAGDLDGLLTRASERRRQLRADRRDYATAWEVANGLLEIAHSRFRRLRRTTAELTVAFDAFVAAQKSARVGWFERDCVYEALSLAWQIDDWRLWGRHDDRALPVDQRLYCPQASEATSCKRRIERILREHESAVERFALGQFLLHVQHERMREEARGLGLRVYGDMHIGCLQQDWWAWQSLFLSNYLLGAPPSRTNPKGQPWGYPLLHPHQIRTVGPRGEIVGGPALEFVRARAEKLFAEFDGIRIDHPQGLVCPWCYRADDPDPFHAVGSGARLLVARSFRPPGPTAVFVGAARPVESRP